MKQSLLSSLLCALLLQATCFGLGADHAEGDLPHQPGWPDGLRGIVNSPLRNHGYWINSNDTLFYQGTPQQLDEMLAALYEALPSKVSVVLHAGKGVAKSPWSKEPIGRADWSVRIHGSGIAIGKQDRVTIHIYLDGNLDLETLRIPAEIPVTAGGEIEGFIKLHSEQGREGPESPRTNE